MTFDAPTAIAYAGAFAGLVGGGVALFNSWKAVCWKRAELANTYMKDFNANEELVFAGRCLDWNGGVSRYRKIFALTCPTTRRSFNMTDAFSLKRCGRTCH
jgi:hypothetical protein